MRENVLGKQFLENGFMKPIGFIFMRKNKIFSNKYIVKYVIT